MTRVFNEKFTNKLIIFTVIVNIILMIQSLPTYFKSALIAIDAVLITYFLAEIIYSIKKEGAEFFKSYFNIFDTFIVFGAALSFIVPISTETLIIFRLFRILKLSNIWTPDEDVEFKKNKRAIRRSLRSILKPASFFITMFLGFAIANNYIFGSYLNIDTVFTSPWNSFFYTFKIFVLEGFSEIESILNNYDNDSVRSVVQMWFQFQILMGMTGVAMVTGIFIDEMTADNSNVLFGNIKSIEANLKTAKKDNKDSFDSLEKKLDEILKQNAYIIENIEKSKK